MEVKTILLTLIFLVAVLGGFFYLMKRKAQNPTQATSSEQTLTQQTTQTETTEPAPAAPTPDTSMPENTLKDSVDYQAVIKTSMGDITVDLFEKEAPTTVNNFVTLAKNGFYDGLIFHRVMEDFMIQGGDPTGTGMGGPGYKFQDEINDKKLVKGALAMANAGPNTNGSQFFIVTAEETPWLDGKHTNFGQVLSGVEVAEAISKVETGAQDKPLQNVIISSIEIIEN